MEYKSLDSATLCGVLEYLAVREPAVIDITLKHISATEGAAARGALRG